jgi:hypothetical protein
LQLWFLYLFRPPKRFDSDDEDLTEKQIKKVKGNRAPLVELKTVGNSKKTATLPKPPEAPQLLEDTNSMTLLQTSDPPQTNHVSQEGIRTMPKTPEATQLFTDSGTLNHTLDIPDAIDGLTSTDTSNNQENSLESIATPSSGMNNTSSEIWRTPTFSQRDSNGKQSECLFLLW